VFATFGHKITVLPLSSWSMLYGLLLVKKINFVLHQTHLTHKLLNRTLAERYIRQINTWSVILQCFSTFLHSVDLWKT